MAPAAHGVYLLHVAQLVVGTMLVFVAGVETLVRVPGPWVDRRRSPR